MHKAFHCRIGPDGLSLFIIGLVCWALATSSLSALEVNGTAYLSLKEMAGKLGMRTEWVRKAEAQTLRSDWTSLEFERHKREVILNGTRIHLGFPIVEHRGQLYLSESDYEKQLQPVLTPQVFGTPPRIHKIMIDAGHGGSDPGARNTALKLTEKNLTLDLARRLKKQLQQAGYAVELTRSKDEFIALTERGRIANRSDADLFLSLHFNASANDRVSGVETFAFTPLNQPSTSRASLHSTDLMTYPGNTHDPWNALLGYYVQRSLRTQLPTIDRGLKRARFAVLRNLTIPGILIEGGFVSQSNEGKNVGSAAYRDRIANSIVEALSVYQQTAERLSANAP